MAPLAGLGVAADHVLVHVDVRAWHVASVVQCEASPKQGYLVAITRLTSIDLAGLQNWKKSKGWTYMGAGWRRGGGRANMT